MSRTLLVTGASGQLGRHVVTEAARAGWQVVGTFRRAPLALTGVCWHRLDITDHGAVARLMADVRPDAVVHTAFHQRGPQVWAVNANGAAAVALAVRTVGARLIHMSSDAIFDGTAAPYTETDDPSPLNLYAASKAAAETAVRALVPDAVLIRTSLIIDDDPIDNHSRMVLDIANGTRSDALFTDEIRCPIAAVDLAAAIVELLDLPVAGILNVAGADAVSRHELGLLIARRYGVAPEAVRGTSLAASGLNRPPDARLDLELARRILKTRLRGVRAFLAWPGQNA
jgi:dTDP-4-dehydrorhamnose reductase